MDPQACFNRIMESLDDNDNYAFIEAFEDLAEWLWRGGFPPVVTSLGICDVAVAYPGYDCRYSLERFEKRQRTYLASHPSSYLGPTHAIMAGGPDCLGKSRFVFVSYDSSGNEVFRKQLALPIDVQ